MPNIAPSEVFYVKITEDCGDESYYECKNFITRQGYQLKNMIISDFYDDLEQNGICIEFLSERPTLPFGMTMYSYTKLRGFIASEILGLCDDPSNE